MSNADQNNVMTSDVRRTLFTFLTSLPMISAIVQPYPVRPWISFAVDQIQRDERLQAVAAVTLAMIMNGMPEENVPGGVEMLARVRAVAQVFGVDLDELRGNFKTS